VSGKNPGLISEPSVAALRAAVVVGTIGFIVALKMDPARAWANLLLSNVYWTGLCGAALAFIAMQFVAKAGWSTGFRRIPEALSAAIPMGLILFIPIYFGMHDLYHWSHAEAVAHDPILAAKAPYLSVGGYFARTIFALGIWSVFAYLLRSASVAQDSDGKTAHTNHSVLLSVLFLIIFGVTFTFGSVDWFMSLEPHWFSTIYPWYLFIGVFVAAIAVISALLILCQKRGLYEQVGVAHYHDLGKFLFAFSVFWAYLWFSQYLLIWYSNIPEETVHYTIRFAPGWVCVFWTNPIVNFIIPSALLLTVRSKRGGSRMLLGCAVILVGRYIDFYQLVMPSVSHGGGPHFGWQEVLIFGGVASLFLLAADRAFRKAAPVPEKDPYLIESFSGGH